jgi:multidrug efflux pump subunit AcrA (membrane-fusion protein)
MAFSLFGRPRNAWQGFSRGRKRFVAGVLIVLAVAGAIAWRVATRSEEQPLERQLPAVRVQTLDSLAKESAVGYQGVVEPAVAAPLVARMGGRVTAIHYEVGDRVAAGKIVMEMDRGNEGNPAKAQITELNAAMVIFQRSEEAARQASDIAVRLAESNLKLAQISQPLNTETTAIARRQADLAVRGAELALQDARDTGIDQAIRAADIAFKNARFAQDQATVSRRLATQGQGLTLQQARLGVDNARAAKETALTQVAAARQQIAVQLTAIREQERLQQVIAPVGGELSGLTFQVGDFITPGAIVGEVNALSGARIQLAVASGTRDLLMVGQEVPIEAPGQSFTGVVQTLAQAPTSSTGLWQVDVFVSSTPEPIHPGDVVTVRVPVSAVHADTYFIPLRMLTIRQDGAVLFTIDAELKARAHHVEIVDFSDGFAEVRSDLSSDTAIVVEGNRTLKDNDTVRLMEQAG